MSESKQSKQSKQNPDEKKSNSNNLLQSTNDHKIKFGLLEAILDSLKKHETARRLSFESDPKQSTYAFLYRQKTNLIPDEIIKKITGSQGDDLVCQILQARSNIMAAFGRPRTSRFAVGFEFVENSSEVLSVSQKEKFKARLERVKDFLWNCGETSLDGTEYFRPNFSQFLKIVTRDALAYGRLACERIYADDPFTGRKKLIAFRPVDAATIYYIVLQQSHNQSVRKQAIKLLQQLQNQKIDVEKYERDEYKYVQIINNVPVQAFTEKEMVMYHFYPTSNIEHNGYPLTPIDQVINAIVTHINISMHNKLYFQHGRAARGMLIIKSNDVNESLMQTISAQFHQSINSVQNSWRMPVFSITPSDDIVWQPIDVSGRDQEFSYLMDQNARVILSSFQMSPEELPGYAHLARGTNTQALAEADNEWKLTAARDVGLRPLICDMQDFINTHILPEIDPELSKYYKLVFAGLEQDSPEKEATRLQQDMNIHLTYNDILQRVEKRPLDKKLGGDLPLNSQFLQSVVFPFLTVGEILENFFDRKGAASDPRYAYYRDPFWFQWQSLILQKAQMSLSAQMASQQAQQAQQAALSNKNSSFLENTQKNDELQYTSLPSVTKNINNNHNLTTKELLRHHKKIVAEQLERWKKETKDELMSIMNDDPTNEQ